MSKLVPRFTLLTLAEHLDECAHALRDANESGRRTDILTRKVLFQSE